MSAAANRSEPSAANDFVSFRWIASCFFLLLIFVVASLIVPEIFSPLVLLSVLVIALSFWIMHRLVGLFNLRRLTIPSAFYFFYLAVIVIPGFFIFAEESGLFRGRYLFAIQSALLTVPMGILIANRLFRFRRHEISNYFEQPVAMELLDSSAARFYTVFLSLGVLLALMHLLEMPVVPLFYLIRNPGEFLEVAFLREESLKLLNSPLVYAYAVLRGTIFPFFIMVALGRYLQRQQRIWRPLFWITLCAGVSYASLTIEKSHVALIFGLIFTFCYLFKGGKLSRKATILAPGLFFAFPLLVMILAYSGTEGGTLSGALLAIAARLFSSPAQILYNYFEVFPNILPYQHGGTITKLGELMGWKVYNIPNVVGIHMDETGDLDTITANSCFLGNLNADFGLPGVVLGGVLAGFLMQALHVYLSRKPKTVVSLAAYAICMWAFAMLAISALPTALLSGGVAFALILSWIFRSPARSFLSNHSNSLGSFPKLEQGPTGS